MIIYRAFARESVRNTAAITLVLVIVMAFIGLTVLLGRAVSGDIAEDIVFQMLGLEALRRLDLLLTLGLYLGVLLTAARWYRDSEMIVLAACGVGLMQLLRPALLLAAAIAAAIAVLGFHFAPWAMNRMDSLKLEREHHTRLADIVPGVFNQSAGGKIVYAESVDRDSGNLSYVFVNGLDSGQESVAVARTGHPYTDPGTGDRFLALKDGNLYQGTPGTGDFRTVRFETLHVRIESKPFVAPSLRVDGMGTFQLLAQTDALAQAEWHWRLSKPLTAIVLVLFALVLAHTDPRRGRLSNLFVAILVYLVYSNELALGQTLLRRGYLPPVLGLWWVHAGMLAVAVYLLVRRAANRPLLAWPGAGRITGKGAAH